MADKHKRKELRDLLNKVSRKLKKQKVERAVEHAVNHPNYFEYLNVLLDSIADPEKRELFKRLSKEIHKMRENGYNTTAWMSLIELYRDISYALDGKLIPDVQVRFERLIGNEVKFVKMQEPDDSDIWEIGDLATGAAANLQPLQDKSNLGEEEVLLNEYLIKILDYRLASLPDEAAWDFVAQSILSISKELG